MSLEQKLQIIENLHNKLIIDNNLLSLIGEDIPNEYIYSTNQLIDAIAKKYLIINDEDPSTIESGTPNLEDEDQEPQDNVQELASAIKPEPPKFTVRKDLYKEIDEL